MERKTLEVAYKAIDDKQGEDIVVIDLREVNPLIDYFVIASANNIRKANAICDEIEDKARAAGLTVKDVHNSSESMWHIADLDTVVCHIFVNEERARYNLEGLWKDLPTVKM